ncbi:alkaline shock response membrane anchor protein AmaP [Streptomyces griseoviridis]|uniref:alkaline shock response membrane anchor protein AmaP n=1 Tax=Streptomyces griseoviridis TaxID=45398 RepID=UPI0033DB7C63
MRNVLRGVNRILLALVGLILLVAGGSVLAVGLGANPPSWWVYGSRHDVLLSHAQRTRWRADGWWWPTVIAVLAVLVLLALWWLAAVLRRRRLAEVLVDTRDGEGARLRGGALEDVFADQTSRLDGVARARVRLRGSRGAPAARLRLLLEPHVDPGTTLQDIATGPLAHARDSARLAELPTEIRVRAVKHRAERVS